ncbi:thymidine phosphorylase family protein [Microbulbifer hydrolyticus]|uniref:Putative thymidine phosphorylase n=1 Tax=Microbulbifer hydrolyticus TaxID=48074 RepID=A0A6P1TD60_9GAMM|nr:thymidine phosphorylase family protein [Microbulbifer hydrolyticus]MBB5213154.1 thymidine phosphorylase [Microbulbifer hydrolyticus]QHQ38642.1 thymidine phosphorylase [Microbulbifer hydrolyticus]
MAHPLPLHAYRMGIDTHEEALVYMRKDCAICRAEGYTANTRLQIKAGERTLIATLNTVAEEILPLGKIGFSESAWEFLNLQTDQEILVLHVPQVYSLSALRKKIYGHSLNATEMSSIIRDIGNRLYSDIEIAGFLTACAGGRLNCSETIALTTTMVSNGNRLYWPEVERVFDKHCIGGLPGNRTTPIVVSIASAAGLVIPKTSSRAITSPAGTADTMEVLTDVDLPLEKLRKVITRTGACLAAGGEVGLSPTDDLLIRIERALNLDSEGQLVASVLSKKMAAGSTHVLIDIPVGPTAKVRDQEQAEKLALLFRNVASGLGLNVRCVVTDGTQAIGNGIGPAEEARDVLSVLRNEAHAPADLTERAVFLAGELLCMATGADRDQAQQQAREILQSGQAWQQFRKICDAQGGLRDIPVASHHIELRSTYAGRLRSMDNRRLARLAKVAGAPSSPEAGLRLRVKVGDMISEHQPVATLYAETSGELAYAREYYHQNRDLFNIAPMDLPLSNVEQLT